MKTQMLVSPQYVCTIIHWRGHKPTPEPSQNKPPGYMMCQIKNNKMAVLCYYMPPNAKSMILPKTVSAFGVANPKDGFGRKRAIASA